ncbi:glycosyltransferase family 2 protein [Winogradskyella flava]|uniref:glycosyltransferase family 2 protein n=1 Tax=Winogradskyella flava TaxID=1884876 RepID=UPI002490EAE8|nr:glycosyltransferase family 2 protein [Winogradskyella flava]
MKVTIITATYNSEQTIGVCMRSVLEQTYEDIEYIIIDGESKDKTLNHVIALIKDKTNVQLISEPDKGIYDALNKGIARATGDIIGFVHSDDFLADSNIIEKIVEVFKSQNVDGIYGNLHYVAFSDTDKIIRNWVSKTFKTKLLEQGWMPAHPTLYLKKELYNLNGGFDLSYKIAADYDFILRIFKQEGLKFYYLSITIVKMRIGGASNRSLKNIINKTKEDYRAVKDNQIGNWFTIVLKNVSKIKQFLT